MANSLTLDVIRQERQRAVTAIEQAERAIAEARSLLDDLDAAERLLNRVTTTTPTREAPIITGIAQLSLPVRDLSGINPHVGRNPFRPGTNKAFMWEVLDTSPTPWLNANQIQERASVLKGVEIPMSSISPHLSEMKDEYLERDNMLVALKSRLKEKGEA